MAEKELTLEERFEKIEEILGKMEEKDATLDESFALYKEGLAELAACNAALDKVEKAMLVISESGELEEF